MFDKEKFINTFKEILSDEYDAAPDKASPWQVHDALSFAGKKSLLSVNGISHGQSGLQQRAVFGD